MITLGVPLALIFYLNGATIQSVRSALLVPVVTAACWVAGFGILWACKWVLSTLVLGWDVIDNAVSAFLLRTGDAVGATAMDSPFSAARLNVDVLFPVWAIKGLAVVAVLLCVVAIVLWRRLRPIDVRTVLLLVALALLPYLWYVVVSNHSYIHYWFTYRAQVVTLVCCLLALESVFHPILQHGALSST